MQNWSKLVFVLILCNSLIVTGEKKNPTLSFLRYRVVPARQVPFPGSPEGSPGNGTWLAGTTLSRRMTAWDSLILSTGERHQQIVWFEISKPLHVESTCMFDKQGLMATFHTTTSTHRLISWFYDIYLFIRLMPKGINILGSYCLFLSLSLSIFLISPI